MGTTQSIACEEVKGTYEDDTESTRTPSPRHSLASLSDEDQVQLTQFCGIPSELDRNKRFHWVPPKGWDFYARNLGISARNNLNWRGKRPVPKAPDCSSWLLPASDKMSLRIAKLEPELRAAGWKIITSKPHVIERLGVKAKLHAYAKEIGLLAYLPRHFSSPYEATYPAILKPSIGEYGRDAIIYHCIDDVLNVTREGFGSRWVLQELIPGQLEFAVSLLVHDGQVIDVIGTCYTYDRPVYVWPHVEELKREPFNVPAAHIAAMAAFLRDYNGILNFNYKLRDDGRISVLEINTRIGSDLGCDAPRHRARELFLLLDKLC